MSTKVRSVYMLFRSMEKSPWKNVPKFQEKWIFFLNFYYYYFLGKKFDETDRTFVEC